MKKYIPCLPIILFPYLIGIILLCIFKGSIITNTFYSLIIALIVLYIISFICAVAVFITGIAGKRKSSELLRMNMVIKLIHIPAYMLIFAFGLICSLTIFTVGITIVLVLLDGMTIALSGLIGLSGIVRGFRENRITKQRAVIHSILQFIYCVDVINSIILFKTIKKAEKA